MNHRKRIFGVLGVFAMIALFWLLLAGITIKACAQEVINYEPATRFSKKELREIFRKAKRRNLVPVVYKDNLIVKDTTIFEVFGDTVVKWRTKYEQVVQDTCFGLRNPDKALKRKYDLEKLRLKMDVEKGKQDLKKVRLAYKHELAILEELIKSLKDSMRTVLRLEQIGAAGSRKIAREETKQKKQEKKIVKQEQRTERKKVNLWIILGLMVGGLIGIAIYLFLSVRKAFSK